MVLGNKNCKDYKAYLTDADYCVGWCKHCKDYKEFYRETGDLSSLFPKCPTCNRSIEKFQSKRTFNRFNNNLKTK